MARGSAFHPPANRDTFRDLLVFEERLKQNAERLQKQRRKYEAFLLSLAGVIGFLAYKVFAAPSIYYLVHYMNMALFLVAVMTMLLFFLTGMYSEKVTYAYKFVPQANRALRPFNIYLNTRLRSRYYTVAKFLRLSSSPSSTPTSAPTSPGSASPPISAPLSRRASSSSSRSSTSARSTRGRGRSPLPLTLNSPSLLKSTNSSDPLVHRAVTPSPPSMGSTSTSRGVPLAPIPPAQNPRGELIFSSRVSATFREGYERYRGEWERRRNEQMQSQLAAKRKKIWGAGWFSRKSPKGPSISNDTTRTEGKRSTKEKTVKSGITGAGEKDDAENERHVEREGGRGRSSSVASAGSAIPSRAGSPLRLVQARELRRSSVSVSTTSTPSSSRASSPAPSFDTLSEASALLRTSKVPSRDSDSDIEELTGLASSADKNRLDRVRAESFSAVMYAIDEQRGKGITPTGSTDNLEQDSSVR